MKTADQKQDTTETDVAYFAYDALGRRIMKTDSAAAATTYYYCNDRWQVIEERTGSDALRQYFLYGNYIDEVVAKFGTLTGLPHYYTHDHLYSPAALVNVLGIPIERYEYDAYGKAHIMDASYNSRTASSYTNPYTFTGRRLDVLDSGSLELMYYRNRYYSPDMGRFMTQDPLGLSFLIDADHSIYFYPQVQYTDGMNIYDYVGSSPLFHKDAYGLYGDNQTECYNSWQNAAAKARSNLADCSLACAGVIGGTEAKCALACATAYAIGGGTLAFKICMVGCTGVDTLIGIYCQGQCLKQYDNEITSAAGAYERCNNKACDKI